MAENGWRQARTVIADRDDEPVRIGIDQDLNRWFSMFQRIAHEVGDDHVEAPRIELGDHVTGLGDCDDFGPAPGSESARNAWADLDLFHHEGGDAGIEPGDLDEVIDEPGKLAGL